MKPGLVFFAHGARDASWGEPFERREQRVCSLAPEAEVRLCCLELTQPDLDAAIDELVAMDVGAIRVVPVFLGQGGHVRRDLPRLIASAQARFPGTPISCAAPAGEDDAAVEALASYCVADNR